MHIRRWNMNEIMSRVRPEEWERRIIFMPSEVRLEIFWTNIKKAPKIHCLALKLYTGAFKSRGQEGFLLKSAKRFIRDSPYLGQGVWPLGPPGSATVNSHNFVKTNFTFCFRQHHILSSANTTPEGFQKYLLEIGMSAGIYKNINCCVRQSK